ncbi:MAG: hypothetical protein K2W96_06675 [Gemmataceae bacterium]|nr:hypothetical protein [Gemmataceae bacterium]
MADELDQREDRELEVIHRQMEQTRANLGDKLEKLEAHVTGTVTAATDTVADAVQSVKDVVGTVTESVATVATTVTETAASVSQTVGGTVAAVADTLNVPKQIEAHPWGAVGAAFGLGFLGSFLFGPKKEAQTSSSAGGWFGPSVAPGAPAQSLPAPNPAPSLPEEPGPVGKLMNQATEGVTELALNAIMGVVRQLTGSLPEQFREPANNFVDDMATSWGVPRKVLTDNPHETPHSHNGAAAGAPQQSRQPEKKEEPARNRGRNRISA